jgi:hypothetical protein
MPIIAAIGVKREGRLLLQLIQRSASGNLFYVKRYLRWQQYI